MPGLTPLDVWPQLLDVSPGQAVVERTSMNPWDDVRAAIDTATKAGDGDTADLFTGVSRGVDKLLWMVEAHTQAKD